MDRSPGPAIGSNAPDVTAPLVDPDGSVSEVGLSSLWAERPVLLVFYTNDFTPDCVKEWCSFRDYDWFTSGETVRVVGVSKSRVSTHRRFIDRLGLTFSLYADTDLAITEAYDVIYRAFKLVKRPYRSCFLIDTDGIVRYRWIAEHPIDPTRDTPPVEEIHGAIAEELGGPDVETFGFG